MKHNWVRNQIAVECLILNGKTKQEIDLKSKNCRECPILNGRTSYLLNFETRNKA